MTSPRCRAKAGAARCTSTRCPARRAAKANGFTGLALGGFGAPTGFPFNDLTATPRFQQAMKSAVNAALDLYDDPEQESEAIGYAASLVREVYPANSQAIHMMNHNVGVLTSLTRDAVHDAYDTRGIWYGTD